MQSHILRKPMKVQTTLKAGASAQIIEIS